MEFILFNFSKAYSLLAQRCKPEQRPNGVVLIKQTSFLINKILPIPKHLFSYILSLTISIRIEIPFIHAIRTAAHFS